ncbi:C40 family peptidase, partial [Lactococcus raffinolactis]|uniref:C40 family peptidase n=1 Tax=Pseudolactococcus raffinolactis TaxID=1366 RepID=UPI0028910C62
SSFLLLSFSIILPYLIVDLKLCNRTLCPLCLFSQFYTKIDFLENFATEPHIPLSEAQAGDLVFFHSTYNAGSYITHVGIYLGNNRMFHAGDPIGYADLTSPYWQQHLVGAGRIKQ